MAYPVELADGGGGPVRFAGNLSFTDPANTPSLAVSPLILNAKRTVYVPDQSSFTGSLIYGDGGQSLSHSSGTQGFYNTGVGLTALAALTTGTFNTGLGYSALNGATSGASNTALGYFALRAATTASQNTAVGVLALSAVTTSGNNTAVGYGAGQTITTGHDNTAIGQFSLNQCLDGYNNTAVGVYAQRLTTSGYENVAVGLEALRFNTTGFTNTCVGAFALNVLTTGDANVAVGHSALFAATTARFNVAVGKFSGDIPNGVSANATLAGINNVFVGYETGASDASDPSDVTAVGYQAVGVVNAVALGSGAQASGSASVAIGKGVVTSIANQIALGTSSHHVLLKTAAAPADASLAASQFTLWLDATNGAAKLMVKAKQANGTVVAGSVTLS